MNDSSAIFCIISRGVVLMQAIVIKPRVQLYHQDSNDSNINSTTFLMLSSTLSDMPPSVYLRRSNRVNAYNREANASRALAVQTVPTQPLARTAGPAPTMQQLNALELADEQTNYAEERTRTLIHEIANEQSASSVLMKLRQLFSLYPPDWRRNNRIFPSP